MSNKNLLLAALALTLSTAACGIEPDRRVEEDRPLIQQQTKNLVSGSFQQDGVAIDFSLARTDDAVHVRIEATDGLVLIDSKIVDGHETTTLLGVYTYTGEPGHITSLDTDVLAELAAMPEMQMLPELKAALDDAGIDPTLVAGLSTDSTLGAIGCKPVGDSRLTAALADRN